MYARLKNHLLQLKTSICFLFLSISSFSLRFSPFFVLPKIGSVFPAAKSTLSTSGSTNRRQAGRPRRVRAPKPDRCLRSAS